MARAMRRGEALFAEVAEDADELRFGCAVDHVRGALALRPAHAHVQRAVVHEAEAALGIVELRRGDAEIEQDAVEFEAGLDRVGAGARARRTARGTMLDARIGAASSLARRATAAGSRSRHKQPTVGDELLQNRPCMSAPPKGGIQIESPARAECSKRRQHLGVAVPRVCPAPSSIDALAPAGVKATAFRVQRAGRARTPRSPATRRAAHSTAPRPTVRSAIPWPISIASRVSEANSRRFGGSSSRPCASRSSLRGMPDHQPLQPARACAFRVGSASACARSPPSRASDRSAGTGPCRP